MLRFKPSSQITGQIHSRGNSVQCYSECSRGRLVAPAEHLANWQSTDSDNADRQFSLHVPPIALSAETAHEVAIRE